MTGQSLYHGRFDKAADELFRSMNSSLAFDWRLVQQDIDGSKAWAGALARAGVLTNAERDAIVEALERIAQAAAELGGPPLDSGAEDVHTWVEHRLVELVGDIGKKLHTGRSRNDQVATDLRLWIRESTRDFLATVGSLRRALAELALREAGTVFPSFTHLQPAQPITFGHWCLAYEQMLTRDSERITDAARRADECPLGSAALAGTAYPIDREALARELGFARPCANSLDAVADRDFVVELLAAAALLGVHLSRLGEDLILYSSAALGLVEPGDEVCSGSSLMPQKKNPDALELIRAGAAQLIALHSSMLINLKGQPLAYNKDLQDDKPTLFSALDRAAGLVSLAERIVRTLRVDRARAMHAAGLGHTTATDLADALVRAGVPFRDAHAQSARLVRLAIELNTDLVDLPLDQARAVAPELTADILASLTPAQCVARRDVIGGTNAERVRAAAEHAIAQLSQDATS